jgi:protein associated with RNAse G/E
MKKITDYSFKDVHGGIIVDNEGNTVIGVSEHGMVVHKGDEAWEDFQRMAVSFVAKAIREQA